MPQMQRQEPALEETRNSKVIYSLLCFIVFYVQEIFLFLTLQIIKNYVSKIVMSKALLPVIPG